MAHDRHKPKEEKAIDKLRKFELPKSQRTELSLAEHNARLQMSWLERLESNVSNKTPILMSDVDRLIKLVKKADELVKIVLGPADKKAGLKVWFSSFEKSARELKAMLEEP